MLNKPEILSPAGTMDALVSAVKAGADAVYLGGAMFSARAFAGNFDTTELLNAIDYCHIHETKLYMAVNTLLKNNEIDRLEEYMKPFYLQGVDGVIVQDFGVAEVLSQVFPDLPLHGSTQMSISSAEGAKFLKDRGFTRVVPARELSLEELTQIKSKVDIELETFVHGAMCFAYSGKCLFSSFAGGRSGNRGRCAQPCRQMYSGDKVQNKYILSMKDMCTLPIIPELSETGIDSFKIEGRMKKPEYIALVTRAYREAVDQYISGDFSANNVERRVGELLDIYNRGGFSKGYYYMQNGKEMLALDRPNHFGREIGKVSGVSGPDVFIKLFEDVNKQDVVEIRAAKKNVELTCGAEGVKGHTITLKGKDLKYIKTDDLVYRTRNNKLISEVRESIIDSNRDEIKAHGVVVAKKGQPLEITISKGNTKVCVIGEEVAKAEKKPVSKEQILSKVLKTGGTGFALTAEVFAEEDIFVSIGAINSLRRKAIEAFKKVLSDKYRRNMDFQNNNTENIIEHLENTSTLNFNDDKNFGHTTVSIRTRQQLQAVIEDYDFQNLIINYSCFYDVIDLLAQLKNKYNVFLGLPDVSRENKEKQLEKVIVEARNLVSGFMVLNIDQLGLLKKLDYQGEILCGPSVYAYNDSAMMFYKKLFKKIHFIYSVELNQQELENLHFSGILKVYGYEKLMVTAQCMNKNFDGKCGQNKNNYENSNKGDKNIFRFSDDRGNSFFAENNCSFCQSIIYNGLPTNIMDKQEFNNNLFDNILIDFTIEDKNEVKKIMNYYSDLSCEEIKSQNKFTRGHYLRGID